MKFALFGNTYQAKKSAHVERLLSILSQHNAEVHICREFYEFVLDYQPADTYVDAFNEFYDKVWEFEKK